MINGEILIRALLISGIVIGMMMIVGIHPVTGSSQAAYDEGYDRGKSDCINNRNYNTTDLPNAPRYRIGYNDGWEVEGCP
jgi:hypothetical protein